MVLPSPESSGLGFSLAGCRVEVEGAARHDTDDTWDANWLSVTAECEAAGACVRVRCAVLTSWSVRRFHEQLVGLATGAVGCAILASETPCFSLCFRRNGVDHPVSARVDLTPDRSSQEHWFSFPVDRGDLARVIERCDAVMRAFPPHELADASSVGE